MNKKIAFGVIGIAVLAVVAGFVFLNSNNESSVSNKEVSTENAFGIDTTALEGDYRLTVVSKNGLETTTSTFEVDAAGNLRTSVDGGEAGGLVYLDGITYVQNASTNEWVSYPAGTQGAPEVSADDFGLSNEELNTINENANIEQLDDEKCPSGTCRVYRDKDEESQEESIILIDKDTNRLTQVKVTDLESGNVTTISYEYDQNIEITAPENATELKQPDVNDQEM